MQRLVLRRAAQQDRTEGSEGTERGGLAAHSIRLLLMTNGVELPFELSWPLGPAPTPRLQERRMLWETTPNASLFIAWT